MNSTLLSTVGTILGVILVILVIIGFAAYGLVRFWQKKIQDDLKKVSSQSRQLINDGKNLRIAIQGYAESDPPPFGALDARILSQLNEFDELNQAFVLLYGDIQQAIRNINQKDWQSILRAPFSWYHLRQRMAGLLEKKTGAGNALQASRSILVEIESQGWVVAGQARLAQERMAKAGQLLAYLQQVNVQSSSFDQAVSKKEQIEKALDGIPEFYLTASEQSVISQSTKESIINVHRILTDNQPEIDSLLSLAETWGNQHKEADNELGALQKLVKELQQLLADMPAGLILSEAEARLDNLTGVVSQVNAGLTKPDLDELPALAQMAADALKDAQATHETLKIAHLGQAELSGLISSIGPERDQLVAKLAQLATRSIYPVVWNKSQVQLNDLLQRIDALGPTNKPRTPEQVEKDLAIAKTLQARIRDLADQYQKVASQHAELMPILTALDLASVLVKYQKAQRLADQVAEYNPENWPRQDAVNSFKVDLDAFHNGLRDMVPKNSSLSLKETELAQQLEQVRTLLEQFLALQQREERIRTRLVELQASENSAQESLSIAQSAINQIGLLSNANQTLKEILAGELEHQLNIADQLSAELGNRQQSLVQKKVQKVSDFYNKAEQASNNWLNKLVVDVKVKKEVITDKIEQLREIADLSEPAIADSQKLLLSLDTNLREGNKPGKKSRFPLAEIMLQYKFANDGWQRSLASTKAIEDIESSVYDAYQKTEQQRHNAEDLLTQAANWVQEARSWPPISITLDAERREFDEIERMREAIRKEQPRAIWLVGRLGDLASRYQAVAEKAHRLGERAEADHNRIRDLERELEESVRLWQYQKNAYSSNTLATANIQRLLSEISRDLDNLKRQYRQGIKNYNQIEQDLILLSRKANSTLIPIEDDQKIDINGEIRMGRS
jgi:chromosome segregation ATPase